MFDKMECKNQTMQTYRFGIIPYSCNKIIVLHLFCISSVCKVWIFQLGRKTFPIHHNCSTSIYAIGLKCLKKWNGSKISEKGQFVEKIHIKRRDKKLNNLYPDSNVQKCFIHLLAHKIDKMFCNFKKLDFDTNTIHNVQSRAYMEEIVD